MDKIELKQILHEQFVPFERMVRAKLDYLQGDNVFNPDEYSSYNDNTIDDNSLENAFNSTLDLSSVPMYQTPSPEAIKQMQQAPRPSYANEGPSANSISEHKQNIAARIAALRGISMPGDYLHGNK